MKEVVTPLHRGGSVRSGQARAIRKKIPAEAAATPGWRPPGPAKHSRSTLSTTSGRREARARAARRAGPHTAGPSASRCMVYLGILPIAAGRRRAAWPSATRVGTELRQGRVVGGRRGSASAVGATTEAL